MNWAHVHLTLNHIPVLGVFFGLLLFVIAILRRDEFLKKISLGNFFIIALLGLAVYLTGEPAEHLVEKIAGVSEAVIDRHEDAALISTIGLGILGLISLIGLGLARNSNRIPRFFVTAPLFGALIVSGLMAWTANLGGQIRHTEITALTNTTLSSDQKSKAQDNVTQRQQQNHEDDDD